MPASILITRVPAADIAARCYAMRRRHAHGACRLFKVTPLSRYLLLIPLLFANIRHGHATTHAAGFIIYTLTIMPYEITPAAAQRHATPP